MVQTQIFLLLLKYGVNFQGVEKQNCWIYLFLEDKTILYESMKASFLGKFSSNSHTAHQNRKTCRNRSSPPGREGGWVNCKGSIVQLQRIKSQYSPNAKIGNQRNRRKTVQFQEICIFFKINIVRNIKTYTEQQYTVFAFKHEKIYFAIYIDLFTFFSPLFLISKTFHHPINEKCML